MFAALVLAAFLAPGAWRITHLPVQPESAASQLVVTGLWFIVVGSGLLPLAGLDRRVVWGLVAAGAAVLAAWLVAGDLAQSAFYDIFGAMPLVQWLAFPAVFALAATLLFRGPWVERALAVCAAAAALLSTVLAYQVVRFDGFTEVFGSTGYSVTALAPFVPVAAALAARAKGPARIAWGVVAGVVALCVGVLAGTTMGTLAVGVGALAGAAAVAFAVVSTDDARRRVVVGAPLALVAIAVVALLVAQVPAVSGGFVTPGIAGENESVSSRVEMWQGAQAMFAEFPLLGVGPSGYRLRAVEFLPPEMFQYGPDQPGNIDPSVYSPQSPHALLWEVGTRLGIAGWLGFGALLVLWVMVLRERLAEGGEYTVLRAGLAAAFVTALFALMVQPVHFAIGLFAPVAAGLAIAPSAPLAPPRADRAWLWRTMALVSSGVLVIMIAFWQLYGLWIAESVSPEDLPAAIEAHEEALRVVPGHPNLERRLLAFRIITAGTPEEIAAAQRDIDLAPGYIREFVPAMVSFAGHSLAQADRTGRADVAWERRVLDEAAERIPPIPSLVAERLHVAIIEGDRAAIEAAIPDAEKWGEPYPFTGIFLQRAGDALRAL